MYELIQRGIDPHAILIIADHLPGDQSIYYASPYAGAYYTPLLDDDQLEFAKYTYENIEKLRDFLGGECGIGRAQTIESSEEAIAPELIRKLSFIADLTVEPSSVAGCTECVKFNGIVFNPPVMTSKMLDKFKLLGVGVTREKVAKFLDVKSDTIFNCSGLGARELANDEKVFSTRGQVIVVRAPHMKQVVTAWTANTLTYIIPRPESKTHEVILGGFYQPHRLDANTYGDESKDILARVSAMCPQLLQDNANGNAVEDLEVLRTVAGARPTREGGVRIEKETTEFGTILHNYGACGTGYLCGLGMAARSVSQLD